MIAKTRQSGLQNDCLLRHCFRRKEVGKRMNESHFLLQLGIGLEREPRKDPQQLWLLL